MIVRPLGAHCMVWVNWHEWFAGAGFIVREPLRGTLSGVYVFIGPFGFKWTFWP